MTGFNMPPGVSPRDIPGNDAPAPSLESEEVCEMLEQLQEDISAGPESNDQEDQNRFWKSVGDRQDRIVQIVEDLATELGREKMTVEDLRQQVTHLQRYAQHTPACAKVIGRLSNRDIECSCGLEPL